jgi:hypothetical protein
MMHRASPRQICPTLAGGFTTQASHMRTFHIARLTLIQLRTHAEMYSSLWRQLSRAGFAMRWCRAQNIGPPLASGKP